ncbi:MAG: flavodoxin-dependent (E)-4-hydroxy-3-methylbut-2-enyl-diphosphate synthase [Gemmataceae bacterium]
MEPTAPVLYQSPFKRHTTRVVDVGGVPVGGDNPIVVQSMTTPDTNQFEAVLKEIHRLEEAGCELVRVTVPKPEDAAVLGEIKKRIKIPLICDIHFDYKMAAGGPRPPWWTRSASTPATSAAWTASGRCCGSARRRARLCGSA